MGRRPIQPAERAIRCAFTSHRARARRRGLAFTLTFDQWWELWAPHWHERGIRIGQKGMCRTRDEGGYTPGNVRIDTVTANGHERAVAHRTRTANRRLQSQRVKSAVAMDWIKPHHLDADDADEGDSA